MIFRAHYELASASVGYLIGCAEAGECVVVDAHTQHADAYVAFVEARRLRLTHVLDTRVRAEPGACGAGLARRTGAAHAALGEERASLALRDGQRIQVGRASIEVLHTPGQFPDAVCLLVRDPLEPDALLVLTGDTLGLGTVGRTDLPGRSREQAGLHYDSVHERLLVLPDAAEVHPARFPRYAFGAPCASTTIGFERRWSPLLRLSREAFVDAFASPEPELAVARASE